MKSSEFIQSPQLSEESTRNYKQATYNQDPIRKVSDIYRRSKSTFAVTDFAALRHNAKLDKKDVVKSGDPARIKDNERMQRVGLLSLPNLFSPDHPDYRIEQLWFQNMSPEQKKAELKKHSREEIRAWQTHPKRSI